MGMSLCGALKMIRELDVELDKVFKAKFAGCPLKRYQGALNIGKRRIQN